MLSELENSSFNFSIDSTPNSSIFPSYPHSHSPSNLRDSDISFHPPTIFFPPVTTPQQPNPSPTPPSYPIPSKDLPLPAELIWHTLRFVYTDSLQTNKLSSFSLLETVCKRWSEIIRSLLLKNQQITSNLKFDRFHRGISKSSINKRNCIRSLKIVWKAHGISFITSTEARFKNMIDLIGSIPRLEDLEVLNPIWYPKRMLPFSPKLKRLVLTNDDAAPSPHRRNNSNNNNNNNTNSPPEIPIKKLTHLTGLEILELRRFAIQLKFPTNRGARFQLRHLHISSTCIDNPKSLIGLLSGSGKSRRIESIRLDNLYRCDSIVQDPKALEKILIGSVEVLKSLYLGDLGPPTSMNPLPEFKNLESLSLSFPRRPTVVVASTIPNFPSNPPGSSLGCAPNMEILRLFPSLPNMSELRHLTLINFTIRTPILNDEQNLQAFNINNNNNHNNHNNINNKLRLKSLKLNDCSVSFDACKSLFGPSEKTLEELDLGWQSCFGTTDEERFKSLFSPTVKFGPKSLSTGVSTAPPLECQRT